MSSFIVIIYEGRLPFFQRYPIVFSFTSVDLQMLVSKFCSFPAISLLARVVVAQDMRWWLPRICGGGGAGYVVGEIKNKANSAQLELELGLSLAIQCYEENQNLKTHCFSAADVLSVKIWPTFGRGGSKFPLRPHR
jgi:hypothetical protein